MNMNVYLPTRLMTGKGIIDKQSHLLKALGNKCLVITDATGAKVSGALDDVVTALKKEGIDYTLFEGITQNPKLTECMDAAKVAIEENVDFLIGIGGGSPLDAAKCTSVLAANKGMDQSGLYSLKWPVHPLPVVAVGTTAGTGSEVTKVSVITNLEGFKKSFNHDTIYPVLSYGDPTYTTKLPDYFTRSTAIDALAHCVESYFNANANEISRAYAIRGIQLLVPMFKKIIAEGTDALTYDDREQLYNASLFGGMAINVTGTALPHTVGYLMTEDYGLPHGIACAVFLPVFASINKKADPKLYATFLKAIDLTEEDYLNIIDGMMPDYSVTMTKEEVAHAHNRWINNGSLNKCITTVTADEVDSILTDMFVK